MRSPNRSNELRDIVPELATMPPFMIDPKTLRLCSSEELRREFQRGFLRGALVVSIVWVGTMVLIAAIIL